MDSSPYAVLARVYDLQHYLYTADLQMYERLARELAPDQPILEIGCGTGRVLIPLAQAGLDIVGIDNSPEMLAIAQQRLASGPAATGPASHPAAASSSSAQLVLADALTYTSERRFGMAFIALNTFLHNLTQAAQLQTLRAARANLADGGYLIIDLPPNDELANQPDDGEFEFEASIIEPDSGTQIEKFVSSRVLWATQEQELSYRMLEREAGRKSTASAAPHKTTEVTFRLRHVFKHEMELLLMQTGFAAPQWYGDYDLSDYGDESPRMIAVARVSGGE
jgi:SAM-dependent methyltransferase